MLRVVIASSILTRSRPCQLLSKKYFLLASKQTEHVGTDADKTESKWPNQDVSTGTLISNSKKTIMSSQATMGLVSDLAFKKRAICKKEIHFGRPRTHIYILRLFFRGLSSSRNTSVWLWSFGLSSATGTYWNLTAMLKNFSQDYLVLVLVCIAILAATGISHAVLLHTNNDKVQVGYVKAFTYIGQLAVSVQVIVVMQRMDIQWRASQLKIETSNLMHITQLSRKILGFLGYGSSTLRMMWI